MGDPGRQTVLIAGAGLAGAMLATYLGRAGYRVRLLERRADPRRGTADAGRSINLALSTRGLHALSGIGLEGRLRAVAVPMAGRMIHAVEGRLTFQPYGTEAGQAINSVSRLGLNIELLDAAEAQPTVELLFERRCLDVDLDRPALVVEDTRTGERSEIAGDVVIGADGAFSAVRRRMQRLERFDFSQSYLAHGYKELTIPAGPDGAFAMERNALHIWPRGGYMMIALPNRDGSYTCTLFWPFEGPNSFDALTDAAAVERYFSAHFPDAVSLMPTLVEDYLANPASSLVTVRCRPWHHEGRVALIGDACHAVVPFYGQGANAAFEDCVVLDRCVREHAPDWSRVFETYERLRKEHVDVLADLAIGNFLEMRDHVASRRFLLKKRLEKTLHRLFPRWFVPLYSMVTFSRAPYADALARDRRQWRAVRAAAGLVGLLLVWLLLSLSGLLFR
jgi:kynurenine 3-monooxygenase